MDPMLSAAEQSPYSVFQQSALLTLARLCVSQGVQTGQPLILPQYTFGPALRVPAASFVTLHREQRLRGCIGSLVAHRPLADDVAANAFAAAFKDPRFKPLQAAELPELHFHISILSPQQSFPVESEQQLLDSLQPGIDGVVLVEGNQRGTFLPSVWEQLPDPVVFLRHLKQKAGLPVDYWSETLKVFKYRTFSFAEPTAH